MLYSRPGGVTEPLADGIVIRPGVLRSNQAGVLEKLAPTGAPAGSLDRDADGAPHGPRGIPANVVTQPVMSLTHIGRIALARTVTLAVVEEIPFCDASSQLAAETAQLCERRWAGMNQAPDRLCRVVVVVLCVRVTCTLAENDVAGAPLQGSGEGCVENRPGVPHSADPSSPL